MPSKSKIDTTLRCAYAGDVRHEYLILKWWEQVTLADDMSQMLASSLHAIQPFLNFFMQPDRLRFAIDERGIWFAFWAEPIFLGAAIGVWARPGMRRTKVMLDCLMRAHDWAFKLYDPLISLTIQPRVASQLKRLGYSKECLIPNLWKGPQSGACIVQHQTRYGWERWKHHFEEKHAWAVEPKA